MSYIGHSDIAIPRLLAIACGKCIMRSALISCLLLSLVLISSCDDKGQMNKNRRFVKQSDVERVGLKGKVKSIITYKYSFVDSSEHCNYIQRVKFNTEGFLVEEIDTIAGRSFNVYKSSYNKDGLLAKLVYAPSEPFTPSVDTYLYSFGEGKKTCITRNPDSSWSSADTTVSLYDSNGNEIESRSGNTKTINKYDAHGFLILSKISTSYGEPWEVSYEK